ncbi:MAG: hypothetical protein ABSE73_01470 [Planctomycetota bacterium]
MAKIREYTDIGHNTPHAILWAMRWPQSHTLEHIERGGGDDPRTHSKVWGALFDEYWRGRYETLTGFCSIAPPYGMENAKRPPPELLATLKAHFRVVRFFYFTPDVHSFSPNPRRPG